MQLKNCTSYDIVFDSPFIEGYKVIFPKSDTPTCCESPKITIADGMVPICTEGEVINLPSPEEDTLFIVPVTVLLAHPDRGDLVTPTHLISMNEQDKTMSCQAFSRF